MVCRLRSSPAFQSQSSRVRGSFWKHWKKANVKAAMAPKASGEVFNVACENSTSLNRIIDLLRTYTEVDTEVIHGPDRAGDIKHSLASIEKARELMDYNPGVSVESGLRMSVEWYRSVRKRNSGA